jgi:hypothetical protein
MDLGEQLILLCDLYGVEDLSDYLLPVSLKLAADKVCEVRQCAFKLVCIDRLILTVAVCGVHCSPYITYTPLKSAPVFICLKDWTP